MTKTRRPVAPLVFSDLRLVVDRPVAKTGSVALTFLAPADFGAHPQTVTHPKACPNPTDTPARR